MSDEKRSDNKPTTLAGAMKPPVVDVPPPPPPAPPPPPPPSPPKKKSGKVFEVIFRHVPFLRKKAVVNAADADEAFDFACAAIASQPDAKDVDAFNGWLSLMGAAASRHANIREVAVQGR